MGRHSAFSLLVAMTLALSAASAQQRDQHRPDADPEFRPRLVSVDFTARTVRPGAQVAVTYLFRNEGAKPARDDYRVFVHLEHPKKSCTCLVVNLDHLPTVPTSAWKPGAEVADGPHVFEAPTPTQDTTYYVHVGVYCPQLTGGPRLLDVYAGEFKVSNDAPAQTVLGPKPLPQDEVARRRKLLAERIQNPIELATDAFAFRLDKDTLAFDLVDRATGVRWASNPYSTHFATVKLASPAAKLGMQLRKFDSIERTDNGLVMTARLHNRDQDTGVTIAFHLDVVDDPPGLRLRYDATEVGEWKVESVLVLENGFGTTEADDGYLVVPKGIGELLPVSGLLPRVLTLHTYSGTSMAMCGLVKQGSGLLLAWPHPETAVIVKIDWPSSEFVPGARMGSAAVELYGAARELTIHPIGRGGYVEIARAYRPVAKRNGWLMTWAEKRKRWPTAEQMFGAADFKPFTFVRVVPSSRYSGKTEQLHVGYTFDEVAQCAEHWRKDLDIDKAMVVMAGWIHRGYDNQHPDVLPAAPECGGNDALARAAKRIKSQGYLFGLHDNYQDMYKDAPSWDESCLNRAKSGKVKMGGCWAGGQAYQVCAIKQVELAARPQNLPMIAKLFGPTIYFIDTTFAWGLVTCEDPAHPMTRYDDMVWKSKLCDLAKEHFGLFGSEKGREWAVPHADYMEGILSDKARAAKGSDIIPLFEMVYGDCTSLYTHQGDRIGPGDAKKTLDHILCAEMPVYAFGRHLYWKSPEAQAVPVQPLPPHVQAAGELEFKITYRWKVLGKPKRDLRCFVHFTHPKATRSEGIAYQDDHALRPATTTWEAGSIVEIGPRTVSIPPQYAGESQLLIGLTGDRGRQPLSNVHGSGDRYPLGTIRTTAQGPQFVAAPAQTNAACFARADHGWAEGMCASDRAIKNTYEVLSHLNRITAERPMTDHAFVTPDRRVERSAFGDVEIIVNYGPQPYEHSGTVLPAYGFLVTSPTFVAFHAQRYAGIDYDPSALFTIRGLDVAPIAKSSKVRIFHGFGHARVRVAGREFLVQREQVVSTQ